MCIHMCIYNIMILYILSYIYASPYDVIVQTESHEMVICVNMLQFVYGKPQLMNAPVADAMESAFIKLNKSESMNNLVAMLRVQPYAAILDGDEFLGLITRSDVLNYLRRQM